MVRTRDESRVAELQKAGATEVVPETLEAGLMIASQSLLLLDVAPEQVMRRMQQQRAGKYRLVREYFRGDSPPEMASSETDDDVRSVEIPPDGACIGRRLAELDLRGGSIVALVRRGHRQAMPSRETQVEAGDVLVIQGSTHDLQYAETDMLYRVDATSRRVPLSP